MHPKGRCDIYANTLSNVAMNTTCSTCKCDQHAVLSAIQCHAGGPSQTQTSFGDLHTDFHYSTEGKPLQCIVSGVTVSGFLLSLGVNSGMVGSAHNGLHDCCRGGNYVHLHNCC